MGGQYVRIRIPMGPAVKWIMAINIGLFLLQLVVATFVGFDDAKLNEVLWWVMLTPETLTRGHVWKLFTHMWLHSPDGVMHIAFNMLVLYFFGPWLEQRWGTRRFARFYIYFGLGGGVLFLMSALLLPLIGLGRGPALGASGAIAGLICAFALYQWRSPLQFFFGITMTGRTLLLVMIAIDLLRLLWGDPLAVEAHWGGMITAALLLNPDWRNPKLWRLKFKRWRLKRRLRLEPGGNSNGDSRYLH